MDAINTNFNNLIFDKASTKAIQTDATSPQQRQQIKAAKDFEAVLLSKLLDQMKDTVDAGGLFDDPVGGQVKSLFYSFLSDDLADKGGIGMWKEIYNMMDQDENISGLVDEKI